MSATVQRIGVQERRHRLGLRHRLVTGMQTDDSVDGIVEAAASVVTLHATDPASMFLSVMARSHAGVDTIERALYDDRALVRMLGMRRTMWVVPRDLAPVVQAGATLAIAAVQRRRRRPSSTYLRGPWHRRFLVVPKNPCPEPGGEAPVWTTFRCRGFRRQYDCSILSV